MESIVADFIADLTVTFPEKANLWENYRTLNKKKMKKLTEYFEKRFPERFFDILYQNEEIFQDENIDTFFLPNVNFAHLFTANISEKTKQALWKYLQLILLKVVDNIQSKNPFGNTAELFQGVSDEDLQKKMEETIGSLKDFFQKSTVEGDAPSTADSTPSAAEGNTEAKEETRGPLPKYMEDLFGKLDSEKLQEHLKKLMGGKIGSLVEEIMEEFKDEFGDLEKEMEGGDQASIQEAMKKMMKNPQQFMGMMKKMTEKIKNKMREGNNQEEFMRETADIFKEMGGREGFMKMFEEMKKTMPKGARVNEQALNQLEKQFKMKERMRENLEKKKAAAAASGVLETTADGKTVFRIPGSEVQEKSVKETKAEVDAIMQKMGLENKKEETKKKTNKKKNKG